MNAKKKMKNSYNFLILFSDKLTVVRLSSDINFHRGSGIYCSVKNFLIEVFLPEGYPESVRDDYWNYQCWDTLQVL